MTPDASLPPADGRLTEQEKAANRRRWWGLTDSPADVQRPTPLMKDAEEWLGPLDAALVELEAVRADLRASRAEVECMADALWAICDGAEAGPQVRIIAAGGLGDRYDHSKPNGR